MVLTSARYAWTIISNVLVFCLFLILLSDVEPMGVTDAKKFTILSTVSLALGAFAVLFFLTGTHEQQIPKERSARLRKLSIHSDSGEGISRGPIDPPYGLTDCAKAEAAGKRQRSLRLSRDR